MLSVLVCTYNQEKYLAQALDSILMQKCNEPFEILIGDDCSTDNTGKIAEDYQSRFPNIVRVVRPEKNGGASLNIVCLANEAKGEFFSICDGDDYWLREDVLQKQLDFFRANPDVGMICAKAKCYIQQDGEYGGTLGYTGAEDLTTMLRDNRDVAAPTIAFRRDLMLRCIADSKWYIDQNWFYDSIITYWFAYNSRIKFIDEEIAAYRVLSSSACHADSPEKEAEYARRYFMVKWHFILTHPDVCNEDMFKVLMHEYDMHTASIMYAIECKIRSTMAYRIGKIIMYPIRKLKIKQSKDT